MLTISELVLSVRLLKIKVSNASKIVSILFTWPLTNGYAGTNEPSCPLINLVGVSYPLSVIISGICAGVIASDVALGGIYVSLMLV